MKGIITNGVSDLRSQVDTITDVCSKVSDKVEYCLYDCAQLHNIIQEAESRLCNCEIELIDLKTSLQKHCYWIVFLAAMCVANLSIIIYLLLR